MSKKIETLSRGQTNQRPDWSVVALTGNKNSLRLREMDRPWLKWADCVFEGGDEQVVVGLREIGELNRGIVRVNAILLHMFVFFFFRVDRRAGLFFLVCLEKGRKKKRGWEVWICGWELRLSWRYSDFFRNVCLFIGGRMRRW